MAFFVPTIIDHENDQLHPSHRMWIVSLLIGVCVLFVLGVFTLYFFRSGNNVVILNDLSGSVFIYLIIFFLGIIVFVMISIKIQRRRNLRNSQNVGISSLFHESYEEPISEHPYRQSTYSKCYSCGESIDMTTIERSQNQGSIYCPHCGVYIELR